MKIKFWGTRGLYNVENIMVVKYSRTTGDPNQRIFDFAHGADVLIRDATYTPEEYRERVGGTFGLPLCSEGRSRSTTEETDFIPL